jgi:hypothetical protein
MASRACCAGCWTIFAPWMTTPPMLMSAKALTLPAEVGVSFRTSIEAA